MNKREVAAVLGYLAEMYPGTRPPADPKIRVEAWHDALQSADATAVMDAARMLVKVENFHPSAARLLSVAVTGTLYDNALTRLQVRRHLGETSNALEVGP